MKKILFICHGNICRSPMAEFVMKDMVAKAGAGEQFVIDSAATSTEELGNPVYPPAPRRCGRPVVHGRFFGHLAGRCGRLQRSFEGDHLADHVKTLHLCAICAMILKDYFHPVKFNPKGKSVYNGKIFWY